VLCPTCGKKNPKKARFCIQCGRPLPAGPLRPERSQSGKRQARPRRSSPGVLLALLSAIAAILVLIFVAILNLLTFEEESVPQVASPSLVIGTSESAAPAQAPVVTVVVGAISSTPMPTPAEMAALHAEPSATATILPTRSPAPTPFPPTLAPSAATATTKPRPTDTPAPAKPTSPKCRDAQKGWIGFKRQKRCDKKTGNACGPAEIWIMKADGSKQAPMCNPKVYEWGLTRDRTSPDGMWRVEVGGRRPDIMRVYSDGRQEMIIVNNRKDWDPALSADGWWLAWVTNRNANDEIYVKTLDPKDQNQRRLTVNDWEWDKHPSWSPDGQKIAFYSNRGNSLSEATCQIWVMDVLNDQGVNFRNLSNRPDQVDTDPVWFKWDEMP